ncbi:hypothetical protein NVP1170O_021 [Vibrio phage 1.170.O._10N.261.52.C3]|nr:hypothetical protein NVP1170O_021 [Vibrio phage 1.170.O._10N.261.52.C3]
MPIKNPAESSGGGGVSLTPDQLNWIRKTYGVVTFHPSEGGTITTTDGTPTLIHSLTIDPLFPKDFLAEVKCIKDDGTNFFRQKIDIVAENVYASGVYYDFTDLSIQNPDDNPNIVAEVVANGNDLEFYVIGEAGSNFDWAMMLITKDF